MDIERLAADKLGKYEIEILLGRGGMSVLHKARHNLREPRKKAYEWTEKRK